MPKNYGKLPVFDQFPLVLPLEIRGGTMLGINMHWIPPPLRLKFIQWTIQLYERPPEMSRKSLFHLWYRIVKSTPAIMFAKFAVRKYYIGRCSNIKIIEPEFWGDLPTVWGTLYKARYLRRAYNPPNITM